MIETTGMSLTWDENDRFLYVESRGAYLTAGFDKASGWFNISDIFVNPDLRRNGIGKALIRAAKAEAERRNATRIIAGIVSRESLDAMRSVFGETSLIVESEGTYESEASLEKIDTLAVLNYTPTLKS